MKASLEVTKQMVLNLALVKKHEIPMDLLVEL